MSKGFETMVSLFIGIIASSMVVIAISFMHIAFFN